VAKIIAFANQKGGVGKTTSCINIAASLAAAKQKILLIDLDPQGNATMGSGVDKSALNYTINEVLLEQVGIIKAIIPKTIGGYDLLAANANLTTAEVGLINKIGRELKLKQALEIVADKYNFILLDCPPSLNMLTLNALVAANSIIIPMQCEYYALEGLSALVNTIEQIKRSINKKLSIEGIILTMFDPRNRLSQDVTEQLHDHFPDKIYRTIVPRNVRLAEAPSHGMPVLLYDKDSRGACAYVSLAREIIKANKTVARKKVQELETMS
jgi:chromosome partitioning protein